MIWHSQVQQLVCDDEILKSFWLVQKIGSQRDGSTT